MAVTIKDSHPAVVAAASMKDICRGETHNQLMSATVALVYSQGIGGVNPIYVTSRVPHRAC